MTQVQRWFEGELRRMLGFDEVEEIARSALTTYSASQQEELRQYLEQFLGQTQEVRKLCDDLSARRRNGKPTKKAEGVGEQFWGGAQSAAAISDTNRDQNKGKGRGGAYKKGEAEEFWSGGATTATTPLRTIPSRKEKTRKSDAGRKAVPESARGPVGSKKAASGKGTPDVDPHFSLSKARDQNQKSPPAGSIKGLSTPSADREVRAGMRGKHGNKYPSRSESPEPNAPRNIRGWSGVTCICMATKHKLITNCTSCGKIACAAEGGYGCSFCGTSLPITGREPDADGIGGSIDAPSDSDGRKDSVALEEALARKDKLLLFDRTSASRTRVLDDQGDYFTNHNWLSRQERENAEAEEKARRDQADARRGAKRQVKVSLDIMGRRVVEARPENDHTERLSSPITDATMPSEDSGTSADAQGLAKHSGHGHSASVPSERSSKDPWREDARPSLQNLGLRGRAKEVYDVMRANLNKRSVKQAGCGKHRAEVSRMSMWRVQHDEDIEDMSLSVLGSDGVSAG